MKIIDEFYDRIFILYFVFGLIVIFGSTLSLLYGFFELNIILAIILSLLFLFLSFILGGGALVEITDNLQDLRKDTKNTYKKELCNSLNKYAGTMPFWVMYRLMRYFNSIPEHVCAPDNKKQEINNRIEDSVSKVKWILSNESVVDVVYRKYAPEQRSELIDAVKNTLKEETKVVKDIKKRSEQYHQSIIEKENNESRQRHSRNVDEFLDEYYAKDQNR